MEMACVDGNNVLHQTDFEKALFKLVSFYLKGRESEREREKKERQRQGRREGKRGEREKERKFSLTVQTARAGPAETWSPELERKWSSARTQAV